MEHEVPQTQSSFEGWLYKRGKLYGFAWDKRFCCLSSTAFEYYEDENKWEKKGTINLGPTSKASAFTQSDAPGDAIKHRSEKENGFVLDPDTSAGKGRGLYYFDAGNNAVLEKWLQEVQRVVISLRTDQTELSKPAKCGLLRRPAGGDRILEERKTSADRIPAGKKTNGIHFNDSADVVDTASGAIAGPKRAAKARVKIGFNEEADRENKIQFNTDDEIVDAASSAVEGPKRAARARVNTGFIKESDTQNDSKQNRIQFNDAADITEAASEAVQGPKRAVRARVNTGFIKETDVSGERTPKIQFNEDDEIGDAASTATDGPKRPARARINTGFIKETDASAETKGPKIQFNDDAEVGDAASMATDGPKRPARARINTGFIKETDSPGERKGPKIQFNDDDDEIGDAASAATDGPKRPARARVNTGFIKETDSPGERKGPKIQFNEDDDIGDAASTATDGPKRPARARVNTGFIKETESPGERKGPKIQFNDDDEIGDAASAATDGPKRPARARVNTGFIKETDSSEERTGPKIQFNDDDEIGDAASTATDGPKRPARARVNTGFIKETDTSEDREPPRIQFNDDADVADAASTATEGPKRSARTRVNTGFIKETDTSEDREPSRIQFNDDADVADAASTATEGPKRSARKRINTGFIQPGGEGDELDDEDKETVRSMSISRRSTRLSMRAGSVMLKSAPGAAAGLQRRDSRRGSNVAKIAENRKLQRCVINEQYSANFNDNLESPEATIDSHAVDEDEDDKNTQLISDSLHKIPFFNGFNEEAMDELVGAMELFEFQDCDEVVRQGDKGGTHFYIVAKGLFDVVQDDKVVAEIDVGVSFGESVLLADGQRNATVRARGYAQVYAMEGAEAHDVLRLQYEQSTREVMTAIDKLLESHACATFEDLNAFQLRTLYEETSLSSFEDKQVVTPNDDVLVLLQGSVVLRREEEDMQRFKKGALIGVGALMFPASEHVDVGTFIVDGSAKVLVITKKVLEDLFGSDKGFRTALMRSTVQAATNAEKRLMGLDEDQRKMLIESMNLHYVSPGKDLVGSTSDICLILCFRGKLEIETSSSNNETTAGGTVKQSKCVAYGAGANFFWGLEQFQNPDKCENLEVRVTSGQSTAVFMTWTKDDAKNIMATDDPVRIIRSMFLFKTLTVQHVEQLVLSMKHERFEDGQAIFNQGDLGESFYIVRSGQCVIEKNDRFIRGLAPGEYFGERALLMKEPRAATIRASGECEVFVISSETFKDLMTPANISYLKARIAMQDAEYTFDDLFSSSIIGTGGFGVVKLVKTRNGERFALKCVRKRPIVEIGQQETLINEREILGKLDHPFIVKLVQTFRNDAFVYFLLELVTGGELLDALGDLGVLNKEQALFYVASIILALEHIHQHRIAYLDLKSENVLVDAQGYIKIIDFGLAIRITGAKCMVLKGTPHFMAPEMVSHQGYDTTADLWALGICTYEFLIGELPFGHGSTSNSEIFKAVMKASLQFPDSFTKQPWADESISLMERLLDKNKSTRLGGGVRGYAELKEHAFFGTMNWNSLLTRSCPPPYVPKREVYGESGRRVSGLTQASRSIAKSETEAERQELSGGWQDPEPGWDDAFES